MSYFLGIDPGKKGGLVIIDSKGEVCEKRVAPLLNKEYDTKAIKGVIQNYPLTHVALEKPGVIFGISKSAVASLMENLGFYHGMLVALEIPFTLLPPKIWQKEMFVGVAQQKNAKGKNDTKATAALVATRLFPTENFKITDSEKVGTKYHDGIIDAVLLAEYVRRNHSRN